MIALLIPSLLLLLSALCVGVAIVLRRAAFLLVIGHSNTQAEHLPEVLNHSVLAADVALMPSGTVPQVSVVVASCNSGRYMDRCLSVLLEQQYPSFEIIVVNASDASDETELVVRRRQNDNPRLRYTGVPSSHRCVDPHKLALTLGIRAARAPWVVVIEPDCRPVSPLWLACMAEHFCDAHDVVMGYVNFEAFDLPIERRVARQRALLWARRARAVLSGRPAAIDGSHWAFRKSLFADRGGFADSLDLPFGEGELFSVAVFSDRTAVELRRESGVYQEVADEETLRHWQYRMRVLRARLRGRERLCDRREWQSALLRWASVLCLLLYGSLRGVLAFFPAGSVLPSDWQLSTSLLTVEGEALKWLSYLPFDVVAFLILFCVLLLPGCSYRRLLQSLHEV